MVRSKVDMMEATRLTRQGRLAEAMAILQGAATSAPAPKTEHGESGAQPSPSERQRPIIDMVSPRDSGRPWTAPGTGAGDTQAEAPAASSLLDRFRALGVSGGVDRLHGHIRTRPQPVVPDGTTFRDYSFSNQAGSRTYKLYVPSGYKGQPLPLIVMLHGCTQSPDDFAVGTRMNELAEEQMFFVAYPAQAQSANPSKCWNWFNAKEQRRDNGEPSLIAGITRQVMRDVSVEPGRMYVAGLSAGGALAAVMGARYPDLYTAIGVHSGLACGAASDVPSAFNAMREGAPSVTSTHGIPTIVFHGDADMTVSPINGEQVIIQAKAKRTLSTTVTTGESDGGVQYTRKVHRDRGGHVLLEHWVIQGIGHAWSGGSSAGSYTEPRGPDASREMVRFFLQS
jgi:poly(hydroxyalkanoate) depolymerase family esterase